ncbi:hypothetical protein [Vibrio europaeus]|uniref:hypothetical protein n=1 Tax=Vibrio europaeus TaxID=300876 RepID=UPI00030D888D|nr:hypothetical protein [Vibrio europaeus]MDC5718231.1 hypothetical protein [Vibrio europaeus]
MPYGKTVLHLLQCTNIPFVFSAFPAKSVVCHHPGEFWLSIYFLMSGLVLSLIRFTVLNH